MKTMTFGARAGAIGLGACVAMMAVSGCAGGPPSSPTQAAQDFYNAALGGDYAKACALALDKDGMPLKKGQANFAACASDLEQQRTYYTVGYGIEGVTVEDAAVDGSNARVELGDIKGLPEGIAGTDFQLYRTPLPLTQVGGSVVCLRPLKPRSASAPCAIAF